MSYEGKKDTFQGLPFEIISEVEGLRYVRLSDVPITQAMIDACKRDVAKYKRAAPGHAAKKSRAASAPASSE